MIRRSEYGPRCPHCGNINPSVALSEADPPGVATCMFCSRSFDFWIERLPFYCTGDNSPARCVCDVCAGKTALAEEVEPHG